MKIKYNVIINKTLAILVLALALSACATNEPTADTAIWIDVRTPGEYSTGHVDKAVNIPYQQIGERITEVTKRKDEKIYVYCGSGHRAEIARKTLAGMGYTDVTNAGGYKDIVKQGNQDESKN